MSLTKEAILACDDLPVEDVKVPEWSTTVRVRGLNCAQRDEYVSLLSKARQGEVWNIRGLKPKLVQLCTLNGDGSLLFAPEDTDAIGKKSAGAIDRIWDVAMRLSGLTAEDEAIKSAEGNSGAGVSAGSGSN